jgi:hypothetical protein
MASYQSGSDAMRAYADTRVAAAEQVLATHHGDATGCCLDCGRTMPCPDRTAADQLRTHYQGLAGRGSQPGYPLKKPVISSQPTRRVCV